MFAGKQPASAPHTTHHLVQRSTSTPYLIANLADTFESSLHTAGTAPRVAPTTGSATKDMTCLGAKAQDFMPPSSSSDMRRPNAASVSAVMLFAICIARGDMADVNQQTAQTVHDARRSRPRPAPPACFHDSFACRAMIFDCVAADLSRHNIAARA